MARSIARGASGPAVQQVQKMLNQGAPSKTSLKEDGEYGSTTEDAVKAAAYRLRKRYRKRLRDLIAETVAPPVKSTARR